MEKLTEENNKLKCEMKLQKEELFEREKEYKEMENKLCQSYQEKEELARKVSKGIIKEDEFVTRLWSLKEVNKNLQKRLDERDQEKKLLQQKIIVLSLQTPQEHKHEDESVTTQEDEDGLRSIPSTFTPQEEPEMVCISKTELNKLLQSYQENHQLKIERLQEQLQKLSLQTPQEHEDESVTTQEEVITCPHSCVLHSFLHPFRENLLNIYLSIYLSIYLHTETDSCLSIEFDQEGIVFRRVFRTSRRSLHSVFHRVFRRVFHTSTRNFPSIFRVSTRIFPTTTFRTSTKNLRSVFHVSTRTFRTSTRTFHTSTRTFGLCKNC